MNSEPRAFDAQACIALLPHVALDANKYSRGTVAVVGGSASYPGAPVMAAMAAARSGAGYVRLITCESAASVARAHILSIPVTSCDESAEGTFAEVSLPQAKEALAKSKVILLGPGMGVSDDVERFIAGMPQDRPYVYDADALNIIAAHPDLLSSSAQHARILTPHEGEAARLLGRKIQDRQNDASLLARQFNATVLLKGPQTLVVDPDGTASVVSEGGPELAKAGTGDVLGGIIASLLAQGLSAHAAACAGAFLHGKAGRLAASKMSVCAVMPGDIISGIGPAILDLEAGSFS